MRTVYRVTAEHAENCAAANSTFEATDFRLGTKLSGFWMSLPVAASVGKCWESTPPPSEMMRSEGSQFVV